MTDSIEKQIEKRGLEVVRVLKPHLLTQSVINADSGERFDTKRVQKNVIMDAEVVNGDGEYPAEFEFSENYAFTQPDSVMISFSAPTATALYAEMTGGNKFKITAASSVTNLKIRVLMRGR